MSLGSRCLLTEKSCWSVESIMVSHLQVFPQNCHIRYGLNPKMGQICVVSLEPRRNRINRNERTTSKRTPQFSVGISEKWPYDLPSIPNFRDFLSNRHPSPSSLFVWETRGNKRSFGARHQLVKQHILLPVLLDTFCHLRLFMTETTR